MAQTSGGAVVEGAAAAGAAVRGGRAWTVSMTAFGVLASVEVLAILSQAATAGQFLGGDSAMRAMHGSGAMVVVGIALIQLIAAVLVWRPGHGKWWPAVVSLVLLLGGFVQTAVGESGNVAVHIPLGVALLGIAVWLASWAWSARRLA